MHWMAPQSSALACFERRRLIREFENAVTDFIRMSSAQLAALRNGESLLFVEHLAAAGLRMDRTRLAIIAHDEEHGCAKTLRAVSVI